MSGIDIINNLYFIFSIVPRKEIQGFINFDREINAMSPTYTEILMLCIKQTNVRGQNIDKLALRIYRIVRAVFFSKDKLGQVQFYKKLFLIADINMEIILKSFSSHFRMQMYNLRKPKDLPKKSK